MSSSTTGSACETYIQRPRFSSMRRGTSFPLIHRCAHRLANGLARSQTLSRKLIMLAACRRSMRR
eukprot:3534493-Pleurochrysis_carterae.AAC.1